MDKWEEQGDRKGLPYMFTGPPYVGETLAVSPLRDLEG